MTVKPESNFGREIMKKSYVNSPYCQYCFDQPFDNEEEYFEEEYCNERCKERFEEERNDS